MKVIVFGRKGTVQRLIAFMAGAGMEVTGISGRFDKVIALQKPTAFDLAVVDSLADEAEVVSNHINKFWAIPLLLVISERQADWKRLQSLDPDGYLREEAEDGELVVRLWALLRRHSSYKTSVAEPDNAEGKAVRIENCPIEQEYYCLSSCWDKGNRYYFRSKSSRQTPVKASRRGAQKD